jgi:predicted GNAT superfamily acetyltransferase
MQLKIRNVEERDLEAVLDLNEAVVPHVNSVNLEKMSGFAEHADYFRVADDNGTIVAMLIGYLPNSAYESLFYRWFCDTYPLFAYIDRVAVKADLRRAGLAAQMYENFENHFRTSVPLLACEVNIIPENPASLAFHARMGFQQVEHAVVTPDVREVSRMIKTL